MVIFDPYEWQVHEDPYPVYRALILHWRDLAPHAQHLALLLVDEGTHVGVGPLLETLHLGAEDDFFDHANAGAVFGAMAKTQQLTPKMLERLKKGPNMPGWVKRESFDWYATISDREA